MHDNFRCVISYLCALLVNQQHLTLAELAISASCLQRAHGCSDKHHRMTLILKKTLKREDSQAGSAETRSI